ncbi:MAG TPA: hypothetical protein EYM25_04655 [Deltaproteobacteria bacterium]|nr:hypothetical protein [Deltaproteobacteria bacterium]
MSHELVKRALMISLVVTFLLATFDLLLFEMVGTAFVTILIKSYSLWIYLRYRLQLDLIKLVEIGALVVDAVLIIEEGFAVACPIASLLTVILVSLNKERFLSKYQHDLDRVLSGRKNG